MLAVAVMARRGLVMAVRGTALATIPGGWRHRGTSSSAAHWRRVPTAGSRAALFLMVVLFPMAAPRGAVIPVGAITTGKLFVTIAAAMLMSRRPVTSSVKPSATLVMLLEPSSSPSLTGRWLAEVALLLEPISASSVPAAFLRWHRWRNRSTLVPVSARTSGTWLPFRPPSLMQRFAPLIVIGPPAGRCPAGRRSTHRRRRRPRGLTPVLVVLGNARGR
uniref:(northern house mosquito) hypothetical protein n=1 Tax=Culex pipiens TaxID=7175 RepID=A0A8D8D015_CULPI